MVLDSARIQGWALENEAFVCALNFTDKQQLIRRADRLNCIKIRMEQAGGGGGNE